MPFREINILDVSNLDKECVKSKLRSNAYTSFKEGNLIFRNKSDYILKLNKILKDTSKFEWVNIEEGKDLNHLIHMEEGNTYLIKCLENHSWRDRKKLFMFIRLKTKSYTWACQNP